MDVASGAQWGLRELWSDRFAEECWMASQEYRGKAKDRMRCDAVGVNATGTRGPSKRWRKFQNPAPWEPVTRPQNIPLV